MEFSVQVQATQLERRVRSFLSGTKHTLVSWRATELLGAGELVKAAAEPARRAVIASFIVPIDCIEKRLMRGNVARPTAIFRFFELNLRRLNRRNDVEKKVRCKTDSLAGFTGRNRRDLQIEGPSRKIR